MVNSQIIMLIENKGKKECWGNKIDSKIIEHIKKINNISERESVEIKQ